MKKVVIALFLLPVILVGLFFLYIYIDSFITREKLYYIPQVKMYIKTIDTPRDGYGYIIFCQDSVFSLSKEVDYIKICRKNEGGSLLYIAINPAERNKLYIMPASDILKINQIHYEITIVKKKETFFEEMPNLVIKKPYLGVYIGIFFERIHIDDNNDGQVKEINAINK